MSPWGDLRRSVGSLEPDAAARVVAAAADIALIVDGDGRIRDVFTSNRQLGDVADGEWQGQRWVETVTIESRPKVEELLRVATTSEPIVWREINHASRRAGQLPIRYSAVGVGGAGTILAIGRDLSTIASLQQQVLDTQRSVEQEYARLRQAEARYRLLFQLSDEAVVIADAETRRILDANPASGRAFGVDPSRLLGRGLLDVVDPEVVPAIEAGLSAARASSRSDPTTVRLPGGSYGMSLTQFRHDGRAHVLVRLVAPGAAAPRAHERTSRLIEQLPDAFIVTDRDRRILEANAAFLEMAELTTPEQARGERIDRWLGRPGVDLPVLAANLREHGSVRAFGTILRGEYGATTEVDVTAVSAADAEEPCLAFVARRLVRRPGRNGGTDGLLISSPDQMTELIGRMPLKQIVTATTDVIERMCIEATLKLTGDNRASAAQMLGLSRQSLYAKLRRHGLGGLDDD